MFKKLDKKFTNTFTKGIPKAFEKAGDKLKGAVKDVKQYGDTVIHGRDDVPPKVRQLLKDHGDDIIQSITINRTPVNKAIIGALNVVSQGHFGKKMDESPYDKLYHLRIDCKLQNGKTLKLEKNEVINADMNPPTASDAETKQVMNMKPNLTPNILMEGGKKVLGNKFVPYDAVHNNCQDFIMALFRGSNIGDQSDFDFIKQDTKGFFKGKDQAFTRKTAKFVTDLGGKMNEIFTGHGLPSGIKIRPSQKIQSIIFDKKMWKLTNCKKWLKKHGFKTDLDDKPEHYRFRQIEPEELGNYKTKDIGEGIKLILGSLKRLKNKSRKNTNMDYNTDSGSDDDSYTGAGLGLGLHDEDDIMHKMCKLSEHIHQHHGKHGAKPKIIKGYQLLGEGIKHSLNQRMEGGKVNRMKKFNNWFKAIGSKFKTLNHNLQPIKKAGTERISEEIRTQGDPSAEAKQYFDVFQEEAPQTMNALRGKAPQPAPVEGQGMRRRGRPTGCGSMFKTANTLINPHSVSNGGNLVKTIKTSSKSLINTGTARANKAMAGSTRGKPMEAIPQGSSKAIPQGSSKGTGVKRGRLVKGSPEAKEWARKMREAKMAKR